MLSQRLKSKGTATRLFLSVFVLAIITFGTNEGTHAGETAIYYEAICVGDGFCAAGLGAVCPGGVPGQQCEMCQFQRSRMKCVFAWWSICVSNDAAGTAAGCGTRWIGSCVGGAGSACISPVISGFCSRITCTSGPLF